MKSSPACLRCLWPAACVVLPVLACGPADELIDIKNQPPVARLIVPETARVGRAAAFDGSLSSDPDGRIMRFHWDFGDLTSADGLAPTHIYNQGGSYTVALVVTDDRGADGTGQATLLVTANAAPTAVIEGPTTIVAGQLAQFSAASSSDSDGTIAGQSWFASDGASGTGLHFDHAFAGAGSFMVSLTVSDDQGATGDAQHAIAVTPAMVDYSGNWAWTLDNEAQRNLGIICGSFQDSQLAIASTPPTISFTESAGSTSVVYSGTISGTAFDVSNSVATITQRIYGTFTDVDHFTGFYAIDPGITTCAERAVHGWRR